MASSECNGNAGGFLMSNTRLLQAAMPAERMRGAKFCEDFWDHLSMIKGGWTLTGAPLFAKNGGLVLNGTTQYASIPLGNELASTTITIHIEWIPTAQFSDSTVVVDSPAANRFIIGGWAAGVTGIIFGGTTIHTATHATWNALLIVGKRNVLTITKATGAMPLVWLNGSLVANAWGLGVPSGLSPTLIQIGKNYAAGVYYAATFSRILIGHYLCTLAEHQAYYNRTMWNWEDRCLVNLQLRTGDFDPTAVRTLDSSGHDLHATLGNGVTPAKYPAQGKGCMTFDGSDYLSCGDAAALRLTNTGTVLVTFKRAALPSWSVLAGKGNFSTGRYGYIVYLDSVTGELKAQISTAATPCGLGTMVYPINGELGVAAFTWDGSFLRIYYNGRQIGASVVQTINAVDNGYPYRVGCDSASESFLFTGSIYDNKVLKEALNSTQVADYTIKMLSTLGAQQ